MLRPEKPLAAVTIKLAELCRRRTITAETLMPVSQRRIEEAHLILERMATAPLDLLEPTRRTASRALPTYRLRDLVLTQLGGAVHYHRRVATTSTVR